MGRSSVRLTGSLIQLRTIRTIQWLKSLRASEPQSGGRMSTSATAGGKGFHNVNDSVEVSQVGVSVGVKF
jgi:hypothetical protein